MNDLIREEFIQNYFQYRWLDETRAKLVDRFFIILVAFLISRFQFSNFFNSSIHWLIILYVLFIIIAVFFARSIVSFRRQQRGHVLFIKAARLKIFDDEGNNRIDIAEYRNYLEGKKVFLTRWIESVVSLIALLSPLLLLEFLFSNDLQLPSWVLIAFSTVLIFSRHSSRGLFYCLYINTVIGMILIGRRTRFL